jgi:DNA (cytosine-5)-methyltransferase 1
MTKRISIFSFFAGAGFLDLGFELGGFDVAFVSEIHSPFMEAYRYSRQCLNLPSPIYGCHEGEAADVNRLIEGKQAQHLGKLVQDCRQTSEFVGFIGGPPCPDFSVGGKNRGREGDNGKLSACYVELICQQQPDFFLFENVKGLWSTKKHRTFFEKLKDRLVEAGYVLTEQLINALEYGIPQNRDRIILIGFKDSLIYDSGIKVRNRGKLPLGTFDWNKYKIYSKNQVFSFPWPRTNPFREDFSIPCPEGIPEDLTVEYWFRKNGVLNHANTEQFFKPRAGIKRFESVDEGDDSKKSYKRLHRLRYSPTACYGNNEVHLHPYKVRRLSVAEALAIQSLPKDFALPEQLSLSNMFKTIGNGVPYLASKALALTIADFLDATGKPHFYNSSLHFSALSKTSLLS